MEKQGTIKYPEFIDQASVWGGKLRDLYNYDLNEEYTRYKRGDKTEYVNILGVRGEMVFSYQLDKNNIDHTMNKMVDNKPVHSWDIKINKNGKRIDVKTSPPDSKFYAVNKDAHESQKSNEIDSYAFVVLGPNQTATYTIFKKEEVDNWIIKDLGFSKAYTYQI